MLGKVRYAAKAHARHPIGTIYFRDNIVNTVRDSDNNDVDSISSGHTINQQIEPQVQDREIDDVARLSESFNPYLENIYMSPIHSYETEAVLTSFSDRPEIPRLFGLNISPDQADCIYEGVRTILSDRRFIASTVDMIAQSRLKAISMPTALSSVAEKNSVTTYEDLKKEFLCAICQDLLAAPVVTSCSHTFCGDCYNQLKMRVVPDRANEVDVCPTCPVDRHLIRSATYVRVLDDSICRSVSKLPQNATVAEWRRRRREYLDSLKSSSSVMDDIYRTFQDDIRIPIAVLSIVVIMLICVSRANRS